MEPAETKVSVLGKRKEHLGDAEEQGASKQARIEGLEGGGSSQQTIEFEPKGIRFEHPLAWMLISRSSCAAI
jgi:hypothetical protein